MAEELDRRAFFASFQVKYLGEIAGIKRGLLFVQFTQWKLSLRFTAVSSTTKIFLDWIYTVGGYAGINREAKTSGERYHLLHDQWQPIQDMNKGRFGHAVVAMNG